MAEYLIQWLGMTAQSRKPLSHRRYVQNTDLHFRPFFGKMYLGKLSGLHIQAFYADRRAAGLGATSINLLHNILHSALKQAVRLKLIVSNPMDTIDPPRKATPEMKFWNAQQAARFLSVADRDKWAALWRLAITTGMRRGELLALRWEDIDRSKGTLSVRRTLSRGSTGGYEFGIPKTNAGRRLVELSPSVVKSLQAHRHRQIEARLAIGPGYEDQDLVFADPIGEPLHANTMRNHFLKLITEAGVPPVRIHDMRHTSATLMFANGEHPKIVSERLGHSNISITLDRYSHAIPAMQREAADRLDKLLEAAV